MAQCLVEEVVKKASKIGDICIQSGCQSSSLELLQVFRDTQVPSAHYVPIKNAKYAKDKNPLLRLPYSMHHYVLSPVSLRYGNWL